MISDDRLGRFMSPSKVALFGDLIRWSAWAFFAVVLVSFLRAHARLWWLTADGAGKSDFTIFYYTARMVADGFPMYGALPAQYGISWPNTHLGNLNPPHFQILTLPFAYLSYTTSLVTWVAAGLSCLFLAFYVVWRELRLPTSLRALLMFSAGITAMSPFLLVSATAELTYFLLVPFTLAWRSARRDRWVEAGIWIGVCVSLKLFFLLLLPWLALQRRWTAIAASALAIILAVLVGATVFGIDAYRQWLDAFQRVGWWELSMNASWTGLLRRTWPGGGQVVAAASVTGAALLCSITLWVSRTSRTAEQVDQATAAIGLAALLASPLGWGYYIPLLMAPVLACGLAMSRHRSIGAMTIAAIGLAFLYVPDEVAASWKHGPMARATLGSPFFWGLLLLWSAVVQTCARTAVAPVARGSEGT